MNARLASALVLVALGLGWGLTIPLSKIAVSGEYRQFGIIFWQMVIAVAVLGTITLARGHKLPWTRRHLRLYLTVAAIGTILPNAASYEAARHLPGGILALLISMVPIFALPMALIAGFERFSWLRLMGVLCGAGAVALIVVPSSALPDPATAIYVPLAMLAAFFYGLEGNYLMRRAAPDIDPVRTLLGASLTGAPVALVLALASGQFIDPRPPWGTPDLAVVTMSGMHALVYAAYIWLIARAGAVFAAQVAYLVTLFGVALSILILGESYSGWTWGALGLMLAGLWLVRPHQPQPLAPDRMIGDTPH